MSINFTKEHLERLNFLEELYEKTVLSSELESELEHLEELQYSRLEEIKNLEDQELLEKYQRQNEFDKIFNDAIPFMKKINPIDDLSAGVTTSHTITNTKNRKTK